MKTKKIVLVVSMMGLLAIAACSNQSIDNIGKTVVAWGFNKNDETPVT